MAKLANTSWFIGIFGDEGAKLRFSPVLSPAMREDGAVPSARMA
jgi:hypothetical protein